MKTCAHGGRCARRGMERRRPHGVPLPLFRPRRCRRCARPRRCARRVEPPARRPSRCGGVARREAPRGALFATWNRRANNFAGRCGSRPTSPAASCSRTPPAPRQTGARTAARRAPTPLSRLARPRSHPRAHAPRAAAELPMAQAGATLQNYNNELVRCAPPPAPRAVALRPCETPRAVALAALHVSHGAAPALPAPSPSPARTRERSALPRAQASRTCGRNARR